MKTLFAAAFLAASAAGFGAANAMPAAPAPASGTGADVIQVAGGCGPGFHRGPYGRCRANRGVVVVRPPMVRKCRYWGPGRRVCRTWW